MKPFPLHRGGFSFLEKPRDDFANVFGRTASVRSASAGYSMGLVLRLNVSEQLRTPQRSRSSSLQILSAPP